MFVLKSNWLWLETENFIYKLNDSLSQKPFEWEGLFFPYVMEKSKNMLWLQLQLQVNIL